MYKITLSNIIDVAATLIIADKINAIDLLGEITGDAVQDEIINQIFSRFCIGK